MSERKAFLEKVHIKNYLSLRDVTLPFKPLTVLVGPNASGKSNVLSALDLLKTMTVDEELPAEEFIQKSLWAGEGQKYSFDLHAKVAESQTLYHLEVKPKPDFPFHAEQLSVNDINVISIQDGQGVVQDENGENEIDRITPINSLWGLLEITETNQLHARWRSLLRNGRFMILCLTLYAATLHHSHLPKQRFENL